MKTIRQTIRIILKKNRNRGVLIVAVSLLATIVDVFGVASIMPFIAVLADPTIVDKSPTLSGFFAQLGYSSTAGNVSFWGAVFFGLFISGILIKAIGTYLQLSFVANFEFQLSADLTSKFLAKPYDWFIGQHSADLGKSILADAGLVSGNAIAPAVTLITQSIFVAGLLILLIVVDYELALTVFLVLGGLYFSIFLLLRARIVRLGNDRNSINFARFKIINDIFGAFKEIKFNDVGKSFETRFTQSAVKFSNNQVLIQILSQLPRLLLEAMAFGGLLLLIISVHSSTVDTSTTLAVASLYALVGYRLLPALQQIYSSLTLIRYAAPAVEEIYKQLAEPVDIVYRDRTLARPFLSHISLDGVVYRYPGAMVSALDGINLEIRKGTWVGIIGKTGSGKSTCVDILMGLLRPDVGSVLIDGKPLDETELPNYRRGIGYTPQSVYLSDDSILTNIAFGEPIGRIDRLAVETAARAVDLHEHIITNLPHQYDSTLGDRGICFSGGQRQRIGIARALYRNPSILVLDEATNAVDEATERKFFKSVRSLFPDLTIILISHRNSSMEVCDKIYVIDSGRVLTAGCYNELVAKGYVS